MLWNIPFLVLSIWYSECFYILIGTCFRWFSFYDSIKHISYFFDLGFFFIPIINGCWTLFYFQGDRENLNVLWLSILDSIFSVNKLSISSALSSPPETILCHAICWWGLPLRFLFDILNFSFPVLFQSSLVTPFLC